jgi:hypothetical protein
VRREKIRNKFGGRQNSEPSVHSSHADRVDPLQESAPDAKRTLSHPPQTQAIALKATTFDVLQPIEAPLSALDTEPAPTPTSLRIEESPSPVATKTAQADRSVSRRNRRRRSVGNDEASSSSRSPRRSRSRDGQTTSASLSPNSHSTATTTGSSWKPNKPQHMSSRHQHHKLSHSSSFPDGDNITSPVPTLKQTPDLNAAIRSAPTPVTKGLVHNQDSSRSPRGRGGDRSGDLSVSQQEEKPRGQHHSPSSRRKHSKPASPPRQTRKHPQRNRGNSQRNRSTGSSGGHKIAKPQDQQEQQQQQPHLLEDALSPEEIAEIMEDIYNDNNNNNTHKSPKKQSRSKRRKSSGSSDHPHHHSNGMNNKTVDGDHDTGSDIPHSSSVDGDKRDPSPLEKQHPRPNSLRTSPGAPSSRRRASRAQIQSLLDESYISPVSRRRGRVGSQTSPHPSLRQIPDLDSTTLFLPPPPLTLEEDHNKEDEEGEEMRQKERYNPPVGALLETQELDQTRRASQDGKGATPTKDESRTKESSPFRQSIAFVSRHIQSTIVKRPSSGSLADNHSVIIVKRLSEPPADDDVEKQPKKPKSILSDQGDSVTKNTSFLSRNSRTRSIVSLEDPELGLTSEHTTRPELFSSSSQSVKSTRKSTQRLNAEEENHPERRGYLVTASLVISTFIGIGGIVMIVIGRNCKCEE